MARVDTWMIKHTTTTGWLWWKKKQTREYYLYFGTWYDVETNQQVDAQLGAKLDDALIKMQRAQAIAAQEYNRVSV